MNQSYRSFDSLSESEIEDLEIHGAFSDQDNRVWLPWRRDRFGQPWFKLISGSEIPAGEIHGVGEPISVDGAGDEYDTDIYDGDIDDDCDYDADEEFDNEI